MAARSRLRATSRGIASCAAAFTRHTSSTPPTPSGSVPSTRQALHSHNYATKNWTWLFRLCTSACTACYFLCTGRHMVRNIDKTRDARAAYARNTAVYLCCRIPPRLHQHRNTSPPCAWYFTHLLPRLPRRLSHAARCISTARRQHRRSRDGALCFYLPYSAQPAATADNLTLAGAPFTAITPHRAPPSPLAFTSRQHCARQTNATRVNSSAAHRRTGDLPYFLHTLPRVPPLGYRVLLGSLGLGRVRRRAALAASRRTSGQNTCSFAKAACLFCLPESRGRARTAISSIACRARA